MIAAPDEVRPRAWWYGVGGGLIGLGVVATVVVFVVAFRRPLEEFRELSDQIDAMDRFAVPGEAVVTLDQPGEYVVYAEGGGLAPIGRVGSGSVTVESTTPDSRPLVLRSVGIDETYDVGGHAGRAAVEFTVDEAGDYRVTVGQVPASVTGVAVGPPLDLFGAIGSIFVAIFVPFAVGGVFVLAGVIVLVVTGVRRTSSTRRLHMAAAPPGAWGAPPVADYPPAGGYPPGGGPPPVPGSPPPNWQPTGPAVGPSPAGAPPESWPPPPPEGG